LSFRDVYDKLTTYIDQQVREHALSEEDVKQLFEMLIYSYFSRFANPPTQTLQDALESTGYRQDYFEGRNAEIILAVADAICSTAQLHFPSFGTGHIGDYYRGTDLADQLQITDVNMHGRDHVVILMPERVYQHLKNEHASRRPSHSA
jgi:hypothetical protein